MRHVAAVTCRRVPTDAPEAKLVLSPYEYSRIKQNAVVRTKSAVERRRDELRKARSLFSE